MDVITSVHNALVQHAIRLRRARRRRQEGATLLEGPHLLAEAVAAGIEIRMVFAAEEDVAAMRAASRVGARAVAVSSEVLGRLAPTEHPRGPIAVVGIPPYAPLVAADTLVLWDVSDPGNAGTLIRTAAAFGYRVALTPASVDPWSPKVLRAAAGVHLRLPVTLMEGADIEPIVGAGLSPVATVVAGGRPVHELALPQPVAVLVGSEAHGLPSTVTDRADVTVTIPMAAGFDSLNAAVAGAIVLFVIAAGRRGVDLSEVRR